MALGATNRNIYALIFAEIGKFLGVGLAIGAVLTFLTREVLRAAVKAVEFRFEWLLLVAVILSLVTLLATYVPTRRVLGIDPQLALRSE
jgi:ABC-type antimicrobial peptide transport system permease subunit